MNYPNLPGDYGRRPPRRSNFFFLFILGFMSLFLFMQYRKASARANAYRKDAERVKTEPIEGIPDFSVPDEISLNGGLDNDAGSIPRGPSGLPIGADTPKNGDWEIDTEVAEVSKQTQLVIGSEKGADQTSSGDWAMEVGESKASVSKQGVIDVAKKPEAKTTKKGDWELGEVEKPAAIAP